MYGPDYDSRFAVNLNEQFAKILSIRKLRNFEDDSAIAVFGSISTVKKKFLKAFSSTISLELL